MPFAPSFVNGFVQISVVLTTTPAYVIDGARFYQQHRAEYSISQQNCCDGAGAASQRAPDAESGAGKARRRVNLNAIQGYNPPISTGLSQP